jgi:uncharacterized protein
MATLSERLDAYRSLRSQVEASILPLAVSVDGRRFSFQAPLEGLELRLGGYAMVEKSGKSALGQIRSLSTAQVDVAQVGLPPGEDDAVLQARLPIRLARGDGVILDNGIAPFRDRAIRPATSQEVGAWLERESADRARLPIGVLPLAGDAAISLDARGFDRHTFLCGQSGSGKSHSLGLLLEQLLLETTLRRPRRRTRTGTVAQLEDEAWRQLDHGGAAPATSGDHAG